MNEGLIPRRYAKALYKVAIERNDTEKLYAIMQKLVETAAAQPSLCEAVSNPFVSVADKCTLLNTAAGSESEISTFADFLKLLAQNKRLDMIFDIAREYVGLYRREKNIARVDVVSASELSEDEQARLKNIIQQHLNGGTMEFTSSVNPDLIGGFTVTVDNQRLDASVKNELKQLRLNLLK